jgi:predicted negative regulator of RcsB-dependent stress response
MIGLVVIAGCATSSADRKMLTYAQVKEAVSKPYPKHAKPIAQLEEKVSRFRDQLTRAVGHRMITEEVAIGINRELAVADYFNTKSWAAMIEGDVLGSQNAFNEAERAYGLALKMLMKYAQEME